MLVLAEQRPDQQLRWHREQEQSRPDEDWLSNLYLPQQQQQKGEADGT